MFGPLRVQTGERSFGPSDLGGLKPKELLEILLLARGRPVTKDVLADKLWPTNAPVSAAGTVETYISVLRKRLFLDRAAARRTLMTTNGAYVFALDGVSVDLDEFDRVVARSERAEAERLALQQQAAEIATGDVLEDSPTAAWAVTDRELYRDRVTRVNVLAAEALLLEGGFAAAIQHGERALAIRPYAEEAVRAVMLANHGLGQSELARRAYERCCDILEDDLGRDCTTATADLAGAIDAGAPIEDLLKEQAPGANLRIRGDWQQPRDRRDAAHQMPFVGRVEELNQIHQVVEKSRGGHFKLVLVRGSPGVGRTAFLARLYSELPGAVGRVKYEPDAKERPTLPLADVIRDALRDGPGIVDADRYGAATLLTGDGRALSMLAELLRVDAPIVLLLDDLQWADVGTVSAIEWLRRFAPSLAVTIVGTVRDLVPVKVHALDLLATPDTIRLSALQEHECRQVDGVDSALVGETGGLPLFMADAFRWRQAGHSDAPPSLRATVLSMTRGLGGARSSLLQEAALQPQPFSPFDLITSEGELPLATLEGLEQLCTLGILEQVPEGFRFRASIVRDVLAATVNEELPSAESDDARTA